MLATKIETTILIDGELHLTSLPVRKGDRVEAILICLDKSPIGDQPNPSLENGTANEREAGAPRVSRTSQVVYLPIDRSLPDARNASMNALDTNIWIYSHDIRDIRKQQIAQNLIASVQSLVLPWQVGCEFIVASRKLAAQGFDETKAWLALEKMQIMANAILLPTPTLWAETRLLQQSHTLSFWDALLVAICIREQVQTPYTEDMGAPRMIGGLSLVYPFLASP